MINPLFNTDFYKFCHADMFPEGTNKIYSNLTSRSARLAIQNYDVLPDFDNKIVFIGLQGMILSELIDLWGIYFFQRDEDTVVQEYIDLAHKALGEDSVNPERIRALHKLGYLPIKIKSLPEGSRVNIGVPVMTIVNTHPDFYWLTNYMESHISANIWKTITVATVSYEYKRLFLRYAEETGASKDFVPIQGHDFSLRGMSGVVDGAFSGIGHLANFFGTDNVPAIAAVDKYYKGELSPLVGCSVPATEHSTQTCSVIDEIEKIEKEISKNMSKEDIFTVAEYRVIKRLITKLYPTGVVSIVSDSFDFWSVINQIAPKLKNEIMNRQPNSLGLNKVVFRPDSGDPVKIICGEEYNIYDNIEQAMYSEEDDMYDQASGDCEGSYNVGNDSYSRYCKVGDKFYKITAEFDYNRHDKTYYYVDNYKSFEDRVKVEEYIPSPEFKGAVECLWEIFGGTQTDKGFKVLDEHVGLIYGDSITLKRAEDILEKLKKKGFSSDNIVFGIGSYTYQHKTRDTFGFAVKATYGEVKGKGREIFKDPITANGSKTSAKGLLRVEKEEDDFILYQQQTEEEEQSGALHTVFEDGLLLLPVSLEDIRKNLNK